MHSMIQSLNRRKYYLQGAGLEHSFGVEGEARAVLRDVAAEQRAAEHRRRWHRREPRERRGLSARAWRTPKNQGRKECSLYVHDCR